MKRFETGKGTSVYVSYCEDVGDNKGGYYGEIFLDFGRNEEVSLESVDNFVIHAEDIVGLTGEMLERKILELSREYIQSVTEY